MFLFPSPSTHCPIQMEVVISLKISKYIYSTNTCSDLLSQQRGKHRKYYFLANYIGSHPQIACCILVCVTTLMEKQTMVVDEELDTSIGLSGVFVLTLGNAGNYFSPRRDSPRVKKYCKNSTTKRTSNCPCYIWGDNGFQNLACNLI